MQISFMVLTISNNFILFLSFHSMDGTRDGEPLRFGQAFYISTMDDEGGNVSTVNSCRRVPRPSG